MPAAYPSFANGWAQARAQTDPAILLATFTHETWGAPYRFAQATYAVVSRGDTYLSSYFETSLVTDDDGPPKATLGFPNPGNVIGKVVDALQTAPEIALEIVSQAHLDEPVYAARRLKLTEIKPDPLFVTGTLIGKDYGSEPCGKIRVTQARFPALFLT